MSPKSPDRLSHIGPDGQVHGLRSLLDQRTLVLSDDLPGIDTSDDTVALLVADLAGLPSNRLEALRGDRAGQYSIRINQQWRICFEWLDRALGPSNVEIVDYH